MAEFPELGKQCSLVSCNKLDYTPFLCRKCDKFYCSSHRFIHGCVLDENIIDEPITQTETVKRFLCSLRGCFVYEIIKFDCSLCEKNFCMKHRISEDHDCVGLKRPDTISKSNLISKPEKLKTASETTTTKFVRKLDPTTQARADKVAIMKAKSKNPHKIPPDEMLVLFVWVNEEERLPFLVSKNWTVGKVADVIISTGRIKNPTSQSKLKLYVVSNLDDSLVLSDTINGVAIDKEIVAKWEKI